jgi:hypothetical protein
MFEVCDDYSGLFAGLHCCGCRELELAEGRDGFRGKICESSGNSCGQFIPQV